MTNLEFRGSSRGKMLFLSKLSFKRFFGNRSALFLSCLVFGVITQALLQSADAQIKYTVTRLVPISEVSSNPTGLNAQGDVVGNYIWRDGTLHVFLNHAGMMHEIAALAGSIPTGINIYGRIVGYVLPSLSYGPYTYFEEKAWSLSRSIPGLVPGPVNTASHIACSSLLGPFMWQKSGITALPGPKSFSPNGINNSDQVVGNAGNLAFLISGGQAIELGTLQNLPGSFSDAGAVNDQGQITGASGVGNVYHAFIYSGGKMQDIQTNPAYISSGGNGINNSGHVVGGFTDSSGSEHGFVYDGSQMIDLDTLIDPAAGCFLYYARAINDAGQITALARFQNEHHDAAILLTPVR